MQFFAVGSIFNEVNFNHTHVAIIVEIVVLIPYIGYTSAHTGSKITACSSEYNNASARHIFAAVVACTLYNGNGTAVTNGKSFANLAVDIQFTCRCPVQTGVACNNIVFGIKVASLGWKDGNVSSRQPFRKIVVGFALELKVDSLHQKCTKALTCRTFKLNVNGGLVLVFCFYRIAFRGFVSHPGIGNLL